MTTPPNKPNCKQFVGGILSQETYVIQEFRQAMRNAGIEYSGEIVADGQLHRFRSDGHRKGTQNGAYKLHLDGIPAGYFQDFRSGIKQTWRADTVKRLTHDEVIEHRAKIDASMRQREAERRRMHEQAASKAAYLWSRAKPATSHPYLAKKRVQAHGTRQLKDSLVIPLHDQSGRLVNLQFIAPDGGKRFLRDGRKQGCFFILGDMTDRILIAEGFATACSLHEETSERTVVAFDAGNLLSVAMNIRELAPDMPIIICGDNDLSGTGQRAANEAALAVGGKVLIPKTPGYDWNDVALGERHA